MTKNSRNGILKVVKFTDLKALHLQGLSLFNTLGINSKQLLEEKLVIGKKTAAKGQFYKHLSILLFIGGAFVIMVLILFGRGQDIEDTNQMADETLTFIKGTCKRYDNYHIGIDADAKENLLDKTKILREYMTEEFLHSQTALSKFAQTQHLTGVLVLDQNLKTTAQADIRGMKPEIIWRKQLDSEIKRNVVTNSNKTFTDKVKIGDTIYYVAMISRKDTKGMILCYRIADKTRIDQNHATFAELMKNNTFHKNPKIMITNKKSILSTNASYLKNAIWTKDVPALEVHWSDHDLTKINFNGRTFYGKRLVYGKYYIYVCYESAEIFSNLLPIVTIGISIYVFCAMMMLLIRQNMKEHSLMEQARQIYTIEAISSLYVSTMLLDLKTKECTPIQYSPKLREVLKFETDGDKVLELLKRFVIAPEYKDDFEQLMKPENIAAQMKKKDSVSFMYQNKEGIWYVTYIVPAQTDADGEVQTVLIASRDINKHQTKEIAYQESLKKIARDAELANAAKTTFLRRMSHDIRTPINGIRGMATLAKHHINEPEKQVEYIEKILTSSDYLLDLVNDVLQMNKLESGKIYLENRSFDMRTLIKETIELCKIQADKQDIKLTLKELKTEHAHLIGSPLHLRQIAQNLITNAIRYNHAGGTVDITWKETGFDGERAVYEFICADTGNGMSEEFQRHLYEPFAQENDNGRSTYSGNGLGLPIVKQLIEYMGGTIEFQSQKGKGTTFIVKIALKTDDHYQREYQEDVSLETISIENTRILLVEDNEINMQIARELLEANGAVITEAHNGKEAIEIFEHAKEGEFDVILMDIMMPVMDGLDAARYIRSLKREDAQKIPIFAMTANAFIEDMKQSKEAGMNEHFSKPLDMDRVIKTIWEYKKN